MGKLYLTFTLPLPQNSGPCNSFYCLGHSKNVYDDDDDDDYLTLSKILLSDFKLKMQIW